MTDQPRGVCPVCARAFTLRVDGGLRHHLSLRKPEGWYRPPVCPGVGQQALGLNEMAAEQ